MPQKLCTNKKFKKTKILCLKYTDCVHTHSILFNSHYTLGARKKKGPVPYFFHIFYPSSSLRQRHSLNSRSISNVLLCSLPFFLLISLLVPRKSSHRVGQQYSFDRLNCLWSLPLHFVSRLRAITRIKGIPIRFFSYIKKGNIYKIGR